MVSLFISSLMRGRFREDTMRLRSQAYNATTLYREYKAFFSGLGFTIGTICDGASEHCCKSCFCISALFRNNCS
jgi:hypothetical protein